jgi:signal transduction histidine kinase
MKLYSKAAVFIFSVAIIAVLVIGYSVFGLTKSALQDVIGKNQLEIARQTMDKIDRLLYERYTDIQAIANAENLQKLLENPVPHEVSDYNRRIQQLTTLTGPWDLLIVVDDKGKIIASSDESKSGSAVHNFPNIADALSQAYKGYVYHSDYFVSKTTGKPAILFAAPIWNEKQVDRPIIGAVIGYFSWPVIAEILNDVEAHTVLLDHNGEVIGYNMKSIQDRIFESRLKEKKFGSEIKSAPFGSHIFQDGKGFIPGETLVSIAPQLGYGAYKGNEWRLILEVPTHIAFKQATKTAVNIAFTFIPLILLMGSLILFLIIQFVIKPIGALTRMTKMIAKGNLSKRIAVNTKDEISDLAHAFNEMSDKLSASYEHLEEKVRERTLELSKLNDELKREIADRKRLEGVVVQSEKMAAVGQLAAGVAHEINNPLGVILGFAQGVTRRLPKGDALELPLQSIEREAVRCRNLVQNLLTFSRIGKTEKEPIEINEAVESSLTLVLAQTRVKEVDLIKKLDSNLGRVMANRNQIQQVILNLCNNAIDAMPRGGRLTVSTKRGNLDGKEMILILVEDTGEGISKELQSKIFDPFFTTKEVGKGTGLGLSLVFEIIQKHEGRISMQSEVKKGTTFSILLPAI